jgi:hypothetical protein
VVPKKSSQGEENDSRFDNSLRSILAPITCDKSEQEKRLELINGGVVGTSWVSVASSIMSPALE